MFRTVQAKFTAAILFVVVFFLLAFLLVNYNLLRAHSLSGAQDTAELIRNGADDRLNQVFREVEYLTRSLAEYRVVKEADVDEMRELFISTVLIRQSYIRAIYLGTEEGDMHEWGVGEGFIDYTPTFPPGYDPRKRPWYKTALEADGYGLTEPYIYASVPALGVTAVIPVRDGEGRLVGVLGIDIILQGLRNVVESLEVQKQGKLMLLTPQGEILVSQFHPFQNNPRDLVPFEYPGLIDPGNFPGVETIYGDRYLVTRGRNRATGWWILLAVPYEEIMAFSQENLKIVIFTDLILTLLLGWVTTLLSRRILTSPLERIMTTMHRMERGDEEARINLSGTDEFSTIGRLFNRLADIRAESSRKMEEKVKARTQAVLRLQQENLRLRIIEEKETIYGNLHDSLGARLTGINISNNVAKDALSRGDETVVKEMLGRIENSTRLAIQDLKEILYSEGGTESRDNQSSPEEFLAYVEDTLRSRLALKEIRLESTLPSPEDLEGVDHSLLHDLEKLIQEITSNIIKHSRAEKAVLTLEVTPRRLHLTVRDDGEGFHLKEESRNGFGIQSLYNRAERMGGILKINTRPGRGTHIDLLVKLEEEL